MTKPGYWVCAIGPVDRSGLPEGADSPPRRAAIDAVSEMTPAGFECSSGWGHSPDDPVVRMIVSHAYREAVEEVVEAVRAEVDVDEGLHPRLSAALAKLPQPPEPSPADSVRSQIHRTVAGEAE